MQNSLLLPQTVCSTEAGANVIQIDDARLAGASETQTLARFEQFLAQLSPAPTQIIGSTATPALYWLLALNAFPQARACYVVGNGTEKRWLESMRNGEHPAPSHAKRHTPDNEPPPIADATNSTPVASAPPQPSQATPASVVPQHPASKTSETSNPAPAIQVEAEGAPTPRAVAEPARNIRELTDGNLTFETFKYAAWGADTPEYARMLDMLLEEALRRAEANPTASVRLPAALQKARRSGEHAHRLGKELETQLSQTGLNTEVTEWIEKVTAHAHPSVHRHLNITLTKWQARQQKLLNRVNERKKTQHEATLKGKPVSLSKLKAVQLVNGCHPNSLRHQQAAAQWEILIDETGSRFDDGANELALSNSELGRVVALAIPQRVTLPELPKGFHAADATDAQVDQALQTVLDAPVGIFGFTVRDTLATSALWIGHIHQLVRWVLLQLPLRSDQPCRVKVRIEERGDWGRRESLRALSSILEDELRGLHAERYRQLHLSLDFIAKNDHDANGYVDAIAFTWGSPGAASKERLKRSGLLGCCLLRPTDEAMVERLYLALDRNQTLPTADWYALCAATSDEPQGGLLHGFSDQLGEQARDTPAVWRECLDEVRQRLRLKKFRLNELAAALDWLERWCPQGTALPAAQQLQLETARLATENHRGEINPQRFQRCFELSEQLVDEAPDEACEAILRLAVTTANNFQFDLLQDILREWLARPVGIPGLLNHAKLHSTLGQLLAFTGRPAEAVVTFDRALAAFSRLSDPVQARRESAQTTIYRLIARLDDTQTPPATHIAEIIDHLRASTGKPDPQAISRSLACAGQQARFDHHLWLRTLTTHPQQLAAERAAYLSVRMQWQAGEDHPWPLIDAYRAWLLHDAGHREDAAQYIGNAIIGCEAAGHGPTLQWMAEVLRVFAQALALPVDSDVAPEARLAELKESLPYAPFAALAVFRQQAGSTLSHKAIVTHLTACLPFNFH